MAFDRTYTIWTWHGVSKEGTSTSDNENNGHGGLNYNEGDRLADMMRVAQDQFDENPATFERMLSDSEKPLYLGCKKYTRLSAILRLYNLKAGHGLTDNSFTEILDLIKDMLPNDNVLPRRTYEAKKMLCSMGLPYEKIHACPNDCVLYQNDLDSLKNCPVCNVSRYKEKEGVHDKVLWYFPIIPRFKRLFSNASDAAKLTWHSEGREKDGKLRHPADSPQWRFIDAKFPEFAKEKRNLRLALSTDGMNPFGNLSSSYSTWPIVLVTYNLPPSLCMKRKYMMLSLLISGPKQLGNDIDVYLAPLIDDLKMLWEKGYTVKGETACPVCEDGMKGQWLSASNKTVYFDHRPFLPINHEYRKRKKAFNGKQEFRRRPKVLSGKEVFEKVKDIQVTFGKKNRSKLPKQGYKKYSEFWRLPYWKFLFVRHCLDVMHIEKNVCDSLINTLLNVKGKTKDGAKARDDFQFSSNLFFL
ncbi:uncharacterized protein LOC110715784 isoform X2 [Chenopodium quinoa]|uniref:uncharacterized protein LOC110715784 isoform X2 n=1 Tax=Chenopodium quinoa TaxID=63459 RepID=UPI000B796750|nr:uncharacterized protein LOC110715784 isoform X2 [Chenopodium quinoa]